MIKGAIIGKFLPFHKGHEALIRFGIDNCNSLDVFVCYTDEEKINYNTRIDWIKQTFEELTRYNTFKEKGINIYSMNCTNMPYGDEPDEYIANFYAQYLNNLAQKYDVLFSSEKYGDLMAKHMPGCVHKIFNQARDIVPISGREIMANPYKNWNYLPDAVKPYFTLKVCIYGSESVGKSTMTEWLAKEFDTVYAHEVARDILDSNAEVNEVTLSQIAVSQVVAVKLLLPQARNGVIFCDTDAITTEIYSQEYLGRILPEIYVAQNEFKYDLYILLQQDGTTWVQEPLRDMGDRRQEMEDKFKKALDTRGIKYFTIPFPKMYEDIKDSYDLRNQIAFKLIKGFIQGEIKL